MIKHVLSIVVNCRCRVVVSFNKLYHHQFSIKFPFFEVQNLIEFPSRTLNAPAYNKIMIHAYDNMYSIQPYRVIH